MYSRQTGFSPYTSEYLKSRYAEKTAPRRSPLKPVTSQTQEKDETLPIQKESPPEIAEFVSSLESDDIILLCVLAFLLFGSREDRNFDLILAAALLFVEFG